MTDEDVVRRFGRAIGLGVVKGPYQHSRQPRNKPHWDWYVSGLEETQAVVSMLWTGLGLRRRARAVEVLNATPLVPRRGRRRRNEALN